MELNTYNLQNINIPDDWRITYNEFFDTDPLKINNDNSNLWFNLKEDLLQVENNKKNLLLDLGWYPEFSPKGKYRIKLIKNCDWEKPLVKFENRNLNEIVKKIEKIVNDQYIIKNIEKGSTETKYEYHDASIEKIEFTENILILYIDLYEVFYKDGTKIKLSFKIKNKIEKCRYWVKQIIEEYKEEHKENVLGARIEAIKVHKEKDNIFNCYIKCNDMERLNFKSSFVEEIELKME